MYPVIRKLTLLLIVILFAPLSLIFGQVSKYEPFLEVSCRVKVGNVIVNFPAIPIRLRQPDIGINDGHGTMRRYDLNESTKTNCKNLPNNKIPHWVVNIDANWETQWEWPPGSGHFYTVTHEHNFAFWNDHYYSDYEGKPDACDYTTNCHGFAFEVGDWPYTAEHIIADPPASDPPDPNSLPPCYVASSIKDAKIATDIANHSIKVEGSECEAEQPPGEPPLGGLPAEPQMVQALVASHEQYRESGTYSQTATCPANVNLKRANKWHTPLPFDPPNWPNVLKKPN